MRKIDTDPETLAVLRLFDEFARSEGVSLQDAESHDAFLAKISTALATHRRNPIAVYGLRVQSMFAYVAAAMGACSTITEEDAGLFLADTAELRRPDFHIVTSGGVRFLVEVKSYSPDDPLAPYEMKASYFERLQRYAERMGRDLKIAIYWRHIEGLWTLVGAEQFDHRGDKRVLPFEAAFKRNEMSELLGDCIIGTVPPLGLKVYTDPEQPRSVAADGTATFTIKRVTLCAAGQEIDHPLERRIAWFLMTQGKWSDEQAPAQIENGELISFEMQIAPDDNPNPEEEFVSVGWLSQMVSRQYRDLTASDGKVSLLSPTQEPGALGVLIPLDYKGQVLRLWRFRLQPNYDDLVRAGDS
jgi:hypothetical protein